MVNAPELSLRGAKRRGNLSRYLQFVQVVDKNAQTQSVHAPPPQLIFYITTNGTLCVPFSFILFHAEAGGEGGIRGDEHRAVAVSYTHLRAHET